MRDIAHEYMPVRAYYASMFIAAIRDSFVSPPEPPETAKRQTKFDYNQKVYDRQAARQWIRSRQYSSDDTGDGFGYVYSVLSEQFGCLDTVHISRFMEAIEKLWKRADDDPSYGKYFTSVIIRPLLKTGIIDKARYEDEMHWLEEAE